MLGWPEIVLIFVVLLLIFGPSKLPEMARTIGEATREFRKATSEIERSLQEPILPAATNPRAIYPTAQQPSNVIAQTAVPPEPAVAMETAAEPEPSTDLAGIAETLHIETKDKSETEVRDEILEKVKALARKGEEV